MPVFAYEGKTSSGEVKKGQLEAADQNAARERLRKMNIQATKVKAKGADISIKLVGLAYHPRFSVFINITFKPVSMLTLL